MFCKNCNTKLGENAKYCSQCGKPASSQESNEIQNKKSITYNPFKTRIKQIEEQKNSSQKPTSINNLSNNEIRCEHCEEMLPNKIKRTFLGFQYYQCPNCHKKHPLPLGNGTHGFYWFIVWANILGYLFATVRGTGLPLFPAPLLPIAAYALYRDRGIFNNLKINQNRYESFFTARENHNSSLVVKLGIPAVAVLLAWIFTSY